MHRRRLSLASFGLAVVCLTLLTAGQCGKTVVIDSVLVADPTFAPNGGAFDDAVDVTLACATSDATIRYTLDGSDPVETSTAYSNPVHLAATTTIKARAYAAGLMPSNVVSATFTRNATPDTYTFDVTWTPTTSVVDENHVSLIKAIDQDNMTYTFDSAGVRAAGLDISQGRVLAIFGEGIAKVAAVTDDGTDMVVQVQAAQLTDAISDGTIAWDYGVRFTADRVQDAGSYNGTNFAREEAIRIGPDELADALASGMLAWQAQNHLQQDASPLVAMPHFVARSIGSDGTITLTFKNGSFDYELKLQLQDTVANFEFTVTKSIASKVDAKFILKGSFGQFRSKDTIKISGGQIREFGHSYEKLSGNATASVVVTGSGNDLGYKKTFPIIKIPFVVGYIPVSLDIGAQFVVNAVVPIDCTAQASADFSYDSDMGFSYDGSKLDATANVMGNTITLDGPQPYAGGASQMSVNFGVGFPHIELSIGHKWLAEASCWFHPAYLVGGSWTANHATIPNCMKVDSEFLVAGGYTLSVLNDLLKPLDGSKTFFDSKKPLWQAGNCPTN